MYAALCTAICARQDVSRGADRAGPVLICLSYLAYLACSSCLACLARLPPGTPRDFRASRDSESPSFVLSP